LQPFHKCTHAGGNASLFLKSNNFLFYLSNHLKACVI
jgi:hypothetical protein